MVNLFGSVFNATQLDAKLAILAQEPQRFWAGFILVSFVLCSVETTVALVYGVQSSASVFLFKDTYGLMDFPIYVWQQQH